jgi:hypothetical protein
VVKASLLILNVVILVTACAVDTSVCIISENLQKFYKGVIDELEINPSSSGTCYQSLSKFNTVQSYR